VVTRSATSGIRRRRHHGSFDLFYLIQNPGPVAATIEIASLLPAGGAGDPQLRRRPEQPPDHPGRRARLAATDVRLRSA
jgi:hypothetical protein